MWESGGGVWESGGVCGGVTCGEWEDGGGGV